MESVSLECTLIVTFTRLNNSFHLYLTSQDLDTLPYNDLTPVGERGVTLTLAQKAKVGLARAVYQGADLYMVDDIFSCIDDKDASHMFTK